MSQHRDAASGLMAQPYAKEELRRPVPQDIEIAQERSKVIRPIREIAESLGLTDDDFSNYGKYKAKVHVNLDLSRTPKGRGKYIVVAGINPTPLGEGKSTTTMGLAQALGAHLNKRCFANVRQPSQGPTFGIKGGAAGGGYAQAVPMEDFNLHGTGDIHAITAANNLLAAAIDARVFHESTQGDDALFRRLTTTNDGKRAFAGPMLRRLKRLGIQGEKPEDLNAEERRRFARLDIDPDTISWRRVMDCNDRFMRKITVGQGPQEKGRTRETAFDITVASEIMAILALATDLADYRERLRGIVVAYSRAGEPVTADDIGCAGALLALLKDSLEPTLMQTLEGTPVFVHAGPFANIAHGNSSIVADQLALEIVGEEGFVLTEAGFGADMGGEKFFNIKCRKSGLKPDAGVIVCTVRALKYHAGKTIPQCSTPDVEAVKTGFANLRRHIDNFVNEFGVPAVVCLNRFASDTQEELDTVIQMAKDTGAVDCVVCSHWADGGAGAVDAAKALVKATQLPSNFKFTYPDEMSLKDKIHAICTKIYGAKDVSYPEEVEKKLADFEKHGYGKFPICMAKTQYSFSHDPELKGAPTGFTVPIKDVRVSCGAGFVFPLLGDISTMPGLPTRPAYYQIDVEDDGTVVGLS